MMGSILLLQEVSISVKAAAAIRIFFILLPAYFGCISVGAKGEEVFDKAV